MVRPQLTGITNGRVLFKPKPYVWKKKGEEILAKIQRAREVLAKNNNV
jgi:hypothetical protein